MHKESKGKNLKDYSKVKLELYRKYLSRYLAIIRNVEPIKNVHVYDVFCGTALLKDGSIGSPLVALDAIKNTENTEPKNSSTHITLTVNDGNKSFSEMAREQLETNKGSTRCDLEVFNMDASQMLNLINQNISTQDSTHRNVIFLDPWGYKNLKMNQLKNIVRGRTTELIIFLPVSHMHRFLESATTRLENKSLAPLRNFINDFFTDTQKKEIAKSNRDHFIELICESLKFKNLLTTCFLLENKANTYGLFFTVPNYLALEKVNEVKWKEDPISGSSFKSNSREGHLQTELFQDTEADAGANLHELKKALESSLQSQNLDNKRIREITLNAGYLPKHANEVLRSWKKSNRISCISVETGKDTGSFYLVSKHYKKPPKIKVSLKHHGK